MHLSAHFNKLSAVPLRALQIALTFFLACMLLACKLVITVPEGGKVISENGFECRSGETCTIDVSDDNFDSTMRAIADPGYTFTRWKRKERAFCGNWEGSCLLTTTSFTDHPSLMEVLESDLEFYLEPIFVGYDVEYWKQTLEEIDQGSSSTAGFLYGRAPVIESCDPGAMQQDPKMRTLEALNQTRALHNLPQAEYDNFYDMQVQESSLVQIANNYLNHSPAPSDRCYTSGAEEAASTSNLSSSSERADPASNVFGWTNDNNNRAALMEAGHRRWMLFPELGFVSYGQVEGFATLKVFGFTTPPANAVPTDLEFVALPFKYYPYILVSQGAKPTPWSISMVPPNGVSSSFNYFDNARVTVTERNSGKSLAISGLHSDNKGFGLSNFLSWIVNGWDYDVDYIVTVSNIRMPGGEVRDIEYPVVVDRYHLVNLNYPRESADTRQGQTMQGKFDSATDRDSYQMPLGGNARVIGQSEFSNWGFFVQVYDQDKRLVKSSDEPFTANFSLGEHTIVISHCDENNLCYQGTRNYSVSFN